MKKILLLLLPVLTIVGCNKQFDVEIGHLPAEDLEAETTNHYLTPKDVWVDRSSQLCNNNYEWNAYVEQGVWVKKTNEIKLSTEFDPTIDLRLSLSYQGRTEHFIVSGRNIKEVPTTYPKTYFTSQVKWYIDDCYKFFNENTYKMEWIYNG